MRKSGFGKQRSEKLSTASTIGLISSLLLGFFMLTIFPASVDSGEKLIVKNSGGAATFSVEDNGRVYTADRYDAQGQFPGFWLDETGVGHRGAYLVLGENWLQVQRRAQGFGAYEASPLFIHIGAPSLSVSVAETGYVGFGVIAAYPLQMASGAHCTAGGVWTNASSREYKRDIQDLTSEEALDALKGLNPVKFRYSAGSDEHHVGFIAEDVPDLVASGDRKGMSPMDVVAVLTRVVQEQQGTIAELSKKVADLENSKK